MQSETASLRADGVEKADAAHTAPTVGATAS